MRFGGQKRTKPDGKRTRSKRIRFSPQSLYWGKPDDDGRTELIVLIGDKRNGARACAVAWYSRGMNETRRAHVASVFPLICAAVAAGELVKDCLAEHGLGRRELSAYLLSTPGAKALWEESREASADAFMDEAMNEARADVDKELAQHVRTRIDTLKWAARIRNPRLYGDKAQLDVNVRTVDLTSIIRDANARLAAVNQNRVIDVTPSKLGEVSAHPRAQSADLVAGILPAELAALL